MTYKRNAGSQQQDSDKQVLKLLHNQLPDALTCRKEDRQMNNSNIKLSKYNTNYKKY